MHSLLATFSYQGSRRLTEVGLLIAVIGGVAIAVSSPRFRSPAITGAIGGLLIAIGLGITIIAVHFGLSPYRR
ncbi:MAG: hypothetical protein WBB74_11455 [Gaiellaceae bacterium]